MNIIKKDLWETPVWTVETGFDSNFNKQLITELEFAEKYDGYNVLSSETRCISTLRNLIISTISNSITGYGRPPGAGDIRIISACLNNHPVGVYDIQPIHAHGGALMACVYYVNVAENCGDLLLIDPRGGIPWDIRTDTKPMFGRNTVSITYDRIKPISGNLVFFPAYISHMVEPNFSNEARISIGITII